MKYIVSAHTSFVKWCHNFREIIYFTFQIINKITCLFYKLEKYFCNKNQESFLCSLIYKRKNLPEFPLVGGKGQSLQTPLRQSERTLGLATSLL